jgi:bacillithiol synthase
VDIRRFPWMRPLALDYAFDFGKVAAFFAGDPSQSESWAAQVRAQRAYARPRTEIAAVIAAQQARRDAPEAARAAARTLADPASLAVVTGQQAGLFGGPVYTLLKAITALRLAARVSREQGVPVVPVFWIDAEDHDWDEIASCGVLGAEDSLRHVTVAPPDGAGERPVGWLRYTDDVARAIEELREALPPTEFTAGLLDGLAADYCAGQGIADAFGRWLERTLGPLGLVVYDSSDPAAKPLASPLFKAEVENAGRTSRLAAEAGAALVALGYHSQVTPADGSLALFDLDGGRRGIRIKDEGPGTKDEGPETKDEGPDTKDEFQIGDEVVSRGALLARATSHPETLSPNVLLRPLVQDTLFPTICYVAGPNELAYLGQLRGVYQSFGIPMPLVASRATATILDAAGVRFLNRYKVPLETLAAQDERALNELLAAQLPPSVERAVQDAEAEIGARMDAIIRAVPAIDPTLEGAARNTLGKIDHDMKTLRGKIVQAAKRRDETLRRQFVHVRAQAFPGGTPQERTVGFVAFVNRYGPALVERLTAELPIDGGTHWIVTV